MNDISKKNINIYWQLLGIYIISRIIISFLGIEPIAADLIYRWQLMPPELLKKDLFGTLYHLHFQPPIWNLIYGIFVKFFGTDYSKLGKIIYYFNYFISIIIIFYFYLICNFFNLKKNIIYITFLIFIIFSLSFLFYEAYLHYMHLTVLIFAQISFFYLKFSKEQSLKFEIIIYLSALFLVFTWSAFSNPLFMLVIFLGIFLIKYKKNLLRSFIVFIIFVFLSMSLSIKNKIEFNLFANSSWIGLQLMQVMHAYHQNHDLCTFDLINIKNSEIKFINNNPNLNVSHPSLIGEYSRFNNVGFIYRTKECLKISLNLIYQEPIKFLQTVKFNFISTHGHFSFDHIGWEPINWHKYFDFFTELKKNNITNQLKVRTLQLYYLFMYVFFGVLLIKDLFNINDSNKKHQKAFSGIFLIYLRLIFAIHFGAGFEQERMRHAGHFLHIIFFILLIKNKFNYRYIKNEFFN